VEGINRITEDSILVTMDVSSLYTNIPHDEGIEAKVNFFSKDRIGRLTPAVLKSLLEAVLKNKNFQFQGKNYLQTGGTAMGSKVAPSYANLFMADLEANMLAGAPFLPDAYYRYIDDIFIFNKTEQKVQDWASYCNQFHHSIKFIMETSTKEVAFLDTIVRKDNDGGLYTTLYTKPTDTHNYLLATSAHLRHVLENAPYSQFLRLRRNCKNDTDFLVECCKMKDDYIRRGYKENIVLKHLSKVLKSKREHLLQQKKSKKQSKKGHAVRFITTYNPNMRSLLPILNKQWHILQQNGQCAAVFNQKPQVVYRKCDNLQDLLVRSQVKPTEPNQEETKKSLFPFGTQPKKVKPFDFKCRDFPCKECKTFQNKDGHFTCTSSGKQYTFHAPQNCKAINVVYVVALPFSFSFSCLSTAL